MHLKHISFFLLFLFGCQSSPQPPDSAQIATLSSAASTDSAFATDDLGRKVLITRYVERVVPIAPSITEILYAAGAGSQVVAVSHADDFPESIRALPRFNSLPMDYEALVRMQPDIIIGTDQINNPRDAHLFESLGTPVLYFSFNSWSDIPRVIRYVGNITANSEYANATADSLTQRVQDIQDNIPEELTRPRVLILIGSDKLYTFGKDSYVHELIEIAGGFSITESLDSSSPELSEEYVITANPDLILGTFGNSLDLLENHPSFQSVLAVSNNQICMVEPSLILRPGPRLIEGMEKIAACIKALDLPEITDVHSDSTQELSE